MRILIAEDDSISRRLLQIHLTRWDYDVVSAEDGLEAWQMLQEDKEAQLAVLDWMMPKMDGTDLCRRIRESDALQGLYVILLTTKDAREDIIKGLEAGANDYVIKPFDPAELRARIRVGERVIRLQEELADRVKALENALAHVRQLQGIIPICSYCKKIRDDGDSWQQLERYMSEHTDAQFSHGICPDCFETIAKPEMEEALRMPRLDLRKRDKTDR